MNKFCMESTHRDLCAKCRSLLFYLTVILLIINSWSVKLAAKVNVICTVGKVGALILIIIGGVVKLIQGQCDAWQSYWLVLELYMATRVMPRKCYPGTHFWLYHYNLQHDLFVILLSHSVSRCKLKCIST